MAVPKKKMSKSRRNSRKFYWKNKVLKKVYFAISISKSLETGRNSSFVIS